MLEPQSRRLLLDMLRPPPGYTLDGAIATTYSLDLIALLTAPLAFTLFDWEDEEGRPAADPLALLEALRRHADHITVFCQAGRIQVPPKDRRLMSYLETTVVEAKAPRDGFEFHAKLWVLRFVAAERPVTYRVICPSRNLTFDTSWDTAVVLEGELVDRERAIARNRPLAELIGALPGLALVPGAVPEAVRERARLFSDELLRVRFELPAPFEDLAFWPMGHKPATPWPFEDRIDRALVISPFLSSGFLERLVGTAGAHVLISRAESLDDIPAERLQRFPQIWTLDQMVEEATPAKADAPDAVAPVEVGAESEARGDQLAGLHAKLYLLERGWGARLLTGSANATSAAFSGNVELLIELAGKKSAVGIDAMLARGGGEPGLIDLLQPYAPVTLPAGDPIARRLEDRLEQARRILSTTVLGARAAPAEDGATWWFSVHQPEGAAPVSVDGMELRIWPVTLHEERAVALGAHLPVDVSYGVVSFEALTTFFAFEIVAEEEGRRGATRFVRNLPLVGAPADRRDRILRGLLSDRAQVLRFLLLLLADDALDVMGVESAFSDPGAGNTSFLPGGRQLLESLVRTLDRCPDRLDAVARLVDDLQASAAGGDLLPDRFLEIWQPIWAVRQRRKQP